MDNLEEQEDYEARSVQDAIRRVHDEDLAARARMAIIRSDMDQFKEMMDDVSLPTMSPKNRISLRKIMEEPVGGAREEKQSRKAAEEPNGRTSGQDAFVRRQPDPAEADAFYRKIRSESEPKYVELNLDQRPLREDGDGEPENA